MRKLAVWLVLIALAALGADVSGTWSFTVQTDAGSGNPTFVFKQDGERLTGKYSGLFGTADLTGTVKGDKIEFRYEATYEGQKMQITYTGAIESATKMSGTAEIAGLGKATWTAEKK